MKKVSFSDRNSNSIYGRSKLSVFNSIILKAYSRAVYVYGVLLLFGLLIDVFGWFTILRKWVICFICRDHFTILSIIVTLLSVIMATFSIVFGNFKICNISANLVLKQMKIGKSGNATVGVIVLIMATPFLMIISQVFHFEVLFFLSFIVAFINLFFMLDLCLTLFTDNGVKYVEIPDNISRELQETVCRITNDKEVSLGRKERLLYDNYVQGITCDDYSVNRIVVPSIVLNNYELKYTIRTLKKSGRKKESDVSRNACLKYKNTYRLFRDIRKYLDRNTVIESDYIETYFGLCSNSLISIIFEINKHLEECEDNQFLSYYAIVLAVFRNLFEALSKIETEEDAGVYEAEMIMLLKSLNTNNRSIVPAASSNEVIKIRAVVWLMLMFQVEYVLKPDESTKKISPKVYSSIINLVKRLFKETVMSIIDFKRLHLEETLSNDEIVHELFEESKLIFWHLSCGISESMYEKKFDQNPAKSIECADRITLDLSTYLGIKPNFIGEKMTVKSSLCFIYTLVTKGGIEL